MPIIYLIVKYIRIASSIMVAIFALISFIHIIYMTFISSWTWENIIQVDDIFNYARPLPIMLLFLLVALIFYGLEKALKQYK